MSGRSQTRSCDWKYNETVWVGKGRSPITKYDDTDGGSGTRVGRIKSACNVQIKICRREVSPEDLLRRSEISVGQKEGTRGS